MKPVPRATQPDLLTVYEVSDLTKHTWDGNSLWRVWLLHENHLYYRASSNDPTKFGIKPFSKSEYNLYPLWDDVTKGRISERSFLANIQHGLVGNDCDAIARLIAHKDSTNFMVVDSDADAPAERSGAGAASQRPEGALVKQEWL